MYVELKNINKSFGSFKASYNVSFGIEKGRLIGLLGPSGSGKTTILRMIAGLETPDSGEIIIDGKVVNNIPAAERGIGFVFQNYALFRYMTVYDNIAFGLKVHKAEKSVIKQRVGELIKLIGLEGLEKRYPSQLSGGQRQRVAFARALAPNPQLLLLDEPFAAIDAKVRQELRSWLKDMIEKLGVTSIFVTHDQDEAIPADRFSQHKTLGELILIDRVSHMTSACGVVEEVSEKGGTAGRASFKYGDISARGDIFEEFYYDTASLNVLKYQPVSATYTVGDTIPTAGESYKYPDSFDIIVLRDSTAIKVRDKKITEIIPAAQYSYSGCPVINGRGFEVKVKSEEEAKAFLSEYAATPESGQSAFFEKWVSFDTYRKVIIHNGK